MKYFYNNQWNEIGIKALEGMPIGSIIQFAGSVIPDGWLVCDGSSVSQSTYPDLYNAIGTTYGVGDGSTTFNLPNLKGRVPVGQDTNDTSFDTLGETGGSKDLQAHNHGGSTGSSLAYDTADVYTTGGSTNFYAITWGGSKVGSDNQYRDKTSHSHTISTDGTGNSGNLQPYLVVNYIIKASQTTPTFATVNDSYSASTTDSYSCHYVNNLVNYSTTEINTGAKWIDGKPIYKRVLEFTSTSTSEFTLEKALDSNTKAVIKIDGIFNDGTQYSSVINSVNISGINYQVTCYYDKYYKKIKLRSTGSVGTFSAYVIVEYTKTTD